jgi:hypothetical protein
LYIPVEIFTFGFDIAHAITSLPLPLFTSGLLLSCTHGEGWNMKRVKKVVDKTKHRGSGRVQEEEEKKRKAAKIIFFGAKKARTTGKSLLP